MRKLEMIESNGMFYPSARTALLGNMLILYHHSPLMLQKLINSHSCSEYSPDDENYPELYPAQEAAIYDELKFLVRHSPTQAPG